MIRDKTEPGRTVKGRGGAVEEAKIRKNIQFVPESSQRGHDICPQQPQHVPGTQQVTESGVEHTQLVCGGVCVCVCVGAGGCKMNGKAKDLTREE